MTTVDLSYCEFCDKQFLFDYIPPLVTSFEALESRLTGTLNNSLLPRNLELFDVYKNSLGGSLRFKEFPRSLKVINLCKNFWIHLR